MEVVCRSTTALPFGAAGPHTSTFGRGLVQRHTQLHIPNNVQLSASATVCTLHCVKHGVLRPASGGDIDSMSLDVYVTRRSVLSDPSFRRHCDNRQCHLRRSPPLRAQSCQNWGTLHGARRAQSDGGPEQGPWEGLLPTPENPTLDKDLRREILKYGDLTELTYDGFISQAWDPKGRFGKPCKDDPKSFIKSMDVPGECLALPQGYTAVKYLWAKSGIFAREEAALGANNTNKENWIGYVAVSKPLSDKGQPQTNGGKVDIAILFRGTILFEEWLTNLGGDYLQPWQPDGEVKKIWQYKLGLDVTQVGGAMAGTSSLLHLFLFTISGAAATLYTSSKYLADELGWSSVAAWFASIASYLEALVGPLPWTAVGVAALAGTLVFVTGLLLVKSAGPMVHRGFQDIYRTTGDGVSNSPDVELLETRFLRSPMKVIEETLKDLLGPGQPPVRSITTAGHSLGGALATLSAAHIAHWLKNNHPLAKSETVDPIQVSAFTFAAPRVGNTVFGDCLREVPVLKVVNVRDLVPKAPGVLLSIYPLLEGALPWLSGISFVLDLWKLSSGVWAYADTPGATLTVDSKACKILRERTPQEEFIEPGLPHNLELYLWLVATMFNGQKEPVDPAGTVSEAAFRDEDKNLQLVDRVRRGTASEEEKRKAEKLDLMTRRDYALTNKSENCLNYVAGISPAFYGPCSWQMLHDTEYGKWRFRHRAHDFETPKSSGPADEKSKAVNESELKLGQ